MRRSEVSASSKRMTTGIDGLDEITDGGLPRGGLAAVFGGAGAGKAVFEHGLEVASTATLAVAHPASYERISTGVERLDVMMSGGYYRGSSVLITGAPGTAKTSLKVAFAGAACVRGESTVPT